MGSAEVVPDSSGRRYVQASPVSAHCNDREHMRVRQAALHLVISPLLTSL
jgi:hypothetical protein